MNERSAARERSEQCGASERVSGASERANGQLSGLVLLSVLLVVLAHSGTPMLEIQIVALYTWKNSSVTQLNGIFVSCMPMSFRFEQFANYNSKTSGPFSFKGPLGR